MANSHLEQRRQTVSQTRHGPAKPERLIVSADGIETWKPVPPPHGATPGSVVPSEIWIRMNSASPDNVAMAKARLESWLNEKITYWADEMIAVYLVCLDAPLGPTGLVDCLDHLAVKPASWPLTLITDGRNLISTAAIDKVLSSDIAEVHVYPAGLDQASANLRVLSAVKELIDLRDARGQNRPRIVCKIHIDLDGSQQIEQWARQVGIDLLETFDKNTEGKRLWD